MPQAQREVNRHQQDAERARLMSMFDTADPHSLEHDECSLAARIRSCSGGAASAYLEVLPIAHNLRIANSHLTWELRFRLGIQVMPSSSAGGRCPCGEVLRGMRDADHALVCSKHSGVRTLRRDHLNRVWCGAARCAGVASGGAEAARAANDRACRFCDDERVDCQQTCLQCTSTRLLQTPASPSPPPPPPPQTRKSAAYASRLWHTIRQPCGLCASQAHMPRYPCLWAMAYYKAAQKAMGAVT